ncbi:MAG: transposase, partial [Gammaproteobacteria bacterium]
PWYHCVCRCVRRAFLCGEDSFSGKNFDHRRGWITERIKQLAAVFAIDVAAYAVMSNHYHVVLRIDRERAAGWSVEEVLKRWTTLFTGPYLVSKYLSDARVTMSDAEMTVVLEMAETCRARLRDLSWFMRALNEFVARMANAEDGVKGRFWEGRFKSQALLDEKALLAAMAYVDLNPIRAGLAQTPEASDFTSIQERVDSIPARVDLEDHRQKIGLQADSTAVALDREALQPESEIRYLPQAELMPFDATGRSSWAIPFAFDDYLELVDWTGRAIHTNKRGQIPTHCPRILDRLGIDGKQFISHAGRLLKEFGSAVGAPSALVELCARRHSKYLRGMSAAKEVFTERMAA